MKYRTFNVEEKEILKETPPRNEVDQTLFKEFNYKEIMICNHTI